MIEWMRPAMDYAVVVAYLLIVAMVLTRFWMRYRRYQREIQGLVIPARHMPPKRGEK